MVEVALTERVDVVLISGDLIDRDNGYYEARIPVEEGVRKLEAAGIPVVAVCGNHDAESLPAICDRIGGALTLLGRRQTWESWCWPSVEAPQLVVHGWSFHQATVLDNPLTTYAIPRHADVPTIGLLHCDLDAARSTYAPVQMAGFESLHNGPDCWVLGHIHVPANRARTEHGTPILYTGSASAMDPGEEGDRGPWIVEMTPGQRPVMRHVPISPVVYRTLTVDVSVCASEADAGEAVIAAIQAEARRLQDGPCGRYLQTLVCRVDVTGDVALEWRLDGDLNQLREQVTRVGETEIVIDRITNATRLRLDLQSLSMTSDPPGLLARRILTRRAPEGDEARRDLLRRARTRLNVSTGANYRQLLPINEPHIAELLEREATLLLRELLGQQAAAVHA